MKRNLGVLAAIACLALSAAPAYANMESDLASAAGNGDFSLVKSLVDNGANLNVKDMEGYTPLIWAAQHGYANVVSYLCEHGANLNPLDGGGYTPLMWAVQEGHYDAAAALLSHGANPNARGVWGRSAVDLTTFTRDGRMRDLIADYTAGRMRPTMAHMASGHTPTAMAMQPMNAMNPINSAIQAQQPAAMAAHPGTEPDPLAKAAALVRMTDSARRAGIELDNYTKATVGSFSLNSLSDPDLPLSKDLATLYANVAQTQSLVKARQDWQKVNADWGNRPTSRFGSYVQEIDQILKTVAL